MRRPKLTAFLLVAIVIAALCGVGSDAAHAARAESVARAVSIALGAEHSCAVTDAGSVRCWGWNNDGQLGDSSDMSHGVAVDVAGLQAPVIQITAGYNHTCALTKAGAIACWGSNTNGQLGAATTASCGTFACSRTPVGVAGLANAGSIAAGFAHTCAITSDGGLKCWGFNLYGQLGDGTTTDRMVPGDVSSLSAGVAAAAPGDVQTCALMNDGTVRCWGNNLLGELGNGTRTASMTPVTVCRDTSCVEPLDDIVQLSSGDYHTCGLTSAGDVFCWGSNIRGQLGVPGPEGCPDSGRPCSSTVPSEVRGLDGPASAISASTASTCVLLQAGSVECWGLQFGSTNIWDSPARIDGWQSGIVSIAAAYDHACAITDAGELLCFGNNTYGQLGDGSASDRDETLPSRVWLLSDRGDADCDRGISSLDALAVLELVAELISSLPCPNAAAAIDQQITSKDALAILQFTARLLT